MTNSMTGYAALDGATDGYRWSWELRSVNGRGLDLRLRMPDWPGELEPAVRAALQKALSRGNVTCTLRLTRTDLAGKSGLNAEALAGHLTILREIEAQAAEAGLTLGQTSAAEIAWLRGVLAGDSDEAADPAPLRDAILADLPSLIKAFQAMRAGEGAALQSVLTGQIDAVAETVAAARTLLNERSDHMANALEEALAKVTGKTESVDEARVAQEIALLAVKADVAEELDRLDAHVEAARALLTGEGPKGRKLDFLSQEFNREANTLCSKAGFAELTRLGLDLKHTIDQMREQIQNVE